MVNVELRLLALMLKTGDFRPILQGELSQDHFITDQGKILYDFIKGYRDESDGKARFPSLIIAKNRLKDSLVMGIPDPDPGDTMEALMHETNVLRVKARAQAVARQLELAATNAEDPLVQIGHSVGELRKLSEQLQKSRHLNLANSFEDVLFDYDIGNILPTGIPWVWPSYQQVTRGMHKKEFVVVCGRPKARKTFTVIAAAVHAYAVHGARVLFFTPEMPGKQVLLRVIATLCALRYAEFKESALNDAEIMRLLEAARKYGAVANVKEGYSLKLGSDDEYEGASFDIVESTGRSLSWMESQIEVFNPDIVVADSFYKQHYEGKKNDSDWKAITATSRGMKDLAMSHNVCVIGTHQLNRESEKGVGTLANLSFADAIGQDADLVIRVITGVLEGKQVSALVNLGGREIPFEGVLINNVPCCDFSEIGQITNRKTVEKLMKGEEDQDAEEEKKNFRKRQQSPLQKKIKNVKGDKEVKEALGKVSYSEMFEDEDDESEDSDA